MEQAASARRPAGPRRALGVALAAVFVAACSAGPRQVALPDPGAGACGPWEAPAGTPAETLTVVADGPADPIRLPHARSLAERLLVRHLYRSLVRVDCRGRVRPDLAEGWERAEGGRRWRFRVPATSGPGGSPITARTAAAAWRESGLAARSTATSPLAGITAEAVDDGTLRVDVPHPLASPAVFARPAFAVVGRPAAGGWPGATGPYRTGRSVGTTLARSPDAAPLMLRPASGRAGPLLQITPAGPDRARDLIDAGVDLVLSRDPGLLAYADAAEEMQTRPLPWDRTYLLLVPPDPEEAGTIEGTASAAPGARRELRRSLARYAVRGAARTAPDEGWWRDGSCAAGGDTAVDARSESLPALRRSDRPVGSRDGRALVHRRGDLAGGELAGRLVALADRDSAGVLPWPRARSPRRTGPREERAFRRSLRAGTADGYVLPVRHRVLDPCAARASLLRRVPWLERPGARVVPLVTTRPGLAVRRGVGELRIDWDGVPRLSGAVVRERP